jgi:AcrR family transcriptional regulator
MIVCDGGSVTGLRERKKEATRAALREAALRLALERGPENVRVDDIAEAAGVSPRTYNNYFSSREQAIVAAVAAERESGIAAAVVGRPADVGLADAVVDAVVDGYCAPRPEALLLITTSPALRASYVDAAATLEAPLAAAITERVGAEPLDASVLAAAVGAAVGVALREWLQAAGASAGGLLVPSGSLPDLIRVALAPLRPALDAQPGTAVPNRSSRIR